MPIETLLALANTVVVVAVGIATAVLIRQDNKRQGLGLEKALSWIDHFREEIPAIRAELQRMNDRAEWEEDFHRRRSSTPPRTRSSRGRSKRA